MYGIQQTVMRFYDMVSTIADDWTDELRGLFHSCFPNWLHMNKIPDFTSTLIQF